MRMPGVEPGSQAWEACMMPLHYMRFWIFFMCEWMNCKLQNASAQRPAAASLTYGTASHSADSLHGDRGLCRVASAWLCMCGFRVAPF